MQFPLPDNLINLLQDKNNFPVIVAYSGGIDSRCLLDIVYNHTPVELRSQIIISHYNHQWSNYSSELADFCKEQVAKNYTECQWELGTAPSQGQTSEGQARNYRYEFFKSISQQYNAKYIFMGHHLEDNIETFFLRLARGSGLKGLGGIPEYRELCSNTPQANSPLRGLGDFTANSQHSSQTNGDNTYVILIHRPFLNTSKQILTEYINSNQLEIYTDPSNTDTNIQRNFVRENIIPLFNELNNNFSHHANQLINTINIEEDYWQQELYKHKTNKQDIFQEYHPALQHRLIKELLESHQIKGVSHSLITTLVQNINTQEYYKYNLQKNTYFIVKERQFCIISETKSPPSGGWGDLQYPPQTHQNLIAPFQGVGGSSYSFTLSNTNTITVNNITITPQQVNLSDIPKSKNPLYLDLSEYTNKTLVIRHKRQGDYIVPLGCDYTCKLQDFLINRKIKNKEELLILAEDNSSEVLAILSVEINNKVKVTSNSSHRIEF